MPLRFRRSLRDYALHKRHVLGISIKHQCDAQRIREEIHIVSECMQIESDEDELDILDEEHDELEKWYLDIVVEPQYIPFKKVKVDVTIEASMPSTFGNKFRPPSSLNARLLPLKSTWCNRDLFVP